MHTPERPGKSYKIQSLNIIITLYSIWLEGGERDLKRSLMAKGKIKM